MCIVYIYSPLCIYLASYFLKRNWCLCIMEFLQKSYPDILSVEIAVVTIFIAAGFAACGYCRKKHKGGCLDPEIFKEFKLVKKSKLSHNAAKFRFSLPTPSSKLGLPVGQYIRCRGKDRKGEEIIKPYTPITLDSDLGYFELVVKMYPNGRMSHHFRVMSVGDYLAVKGPTGRFKYEPGHAKSIGMLAGGTGITPMFQIIRAILENPKDKTEVYLIYANHTYKDILLKEELDVFACKFPNRFKVYYVLTEAHGEWNGGVGHISRDMIQTHCPSPGPYIQILRCGPPSMNKAMSAHLNSLGYTLDMQFEF